MIPSLHFFLVVIKQWRIQIIIMFYPRIFDQFSQSVLCKLFHIMELRIVISELGQWSIGLVWREVNWDGAQIKEIGVFRKGAFLLGKSVVVNTGQLTLELPPGLGTAPADCKS